MYHYTVLFRLREGVTLDRVRGAVEALGALVETLPGVEHFAVTHNELKDGGGFSLALFAGFENQKAWEIYCRHPEVLRIEDSVLGPVVAERVRAAGQGQEI